MIEKKNIRGTEAFLLALIEEGVDTVFGYPGGGIMPLYDELYFHQDQINHILVRHEQGAVHAAQGYARSCGKTGVCMATAGPGATNFVTGIADAMLDSTPLVCVTAQVNKENLGSSFFQEADMINITLPITKWSYQITSASEIPEVVAKAFHIASSGRPGPVLISFTKNAQMESFDFRYDHQAYRKSVEAGLPTGLESAAAQAAQMLDKAEKPIILAGHGVVLSGAEEALMALAEKTGIPVATTLLGLSCFPTDHPLSLGGAGMHGHLAPNRMTQEADLILAVGMRFSDRVTGNPVGYAPRAKIIHIEIDPTEISRNVKAALPIVADAKTALEAICRQPLEYHERKSWLEEAKRHKEEETNTVIRKDLYGDDGSGLIRMAQAVREVASQLDKNAVLVTDVGQNQMFAARYSRFYKDTKWITSGGLGTMGFGLPAAIGAKFGQPDRQVVVFLGDGGFQMTIEELGTIMQTGAAVKIVLLNNTYLGMVRQWQDLFYGKRYAFTHLTNPDFVQLVSAYGIHSERVTAAKDLQEAVRTMLTVPGPAFLEIDTDPRENVFPMVPAGASLDGLITGADC